MPLLDESFAIAGRPLGPGHPPYVIAEIGSNFDQSFDRARSMIDEAAAAGADAVKFQLFRAEELYPVGHQYHALFKGIELDPAWLPGLRDHAAAAGVHFLASAFDRPSIRALEEVGVPAHKVASSEVTRLDIVATMAASGKPLLLSTGMSDMADIALALALARDFGNTRIALFQCVASYPLDPAKANLRVMDQYRAAFGGPTGFSDHTMSVAAGGFAVARGASILEKHVTHSRAAPGPDHGFALEPAEFRAYVAQVREAHAMLGDGIKLALPEELAAGRRNGLYAGRALAAGTVLAATDVEERRPAPGIRARFAAAAAGARVIRAVEAGAALDWTDIAP